PAGEHGPPFPPAYLILMFDLDYLKREFIPELVNRHFLSEGRLDYYVAIVKSSPSKPTVLYQSDAELPADLLTRSDASESFFNFHGPGFGGMLTTGWAGRRHVRASLPPGRPVTIGIELETATPSAGVEGPRIVPPAEVPPGLPPPKGSWQILVKHRAGSLEAVVAGTHRRNLAMSFGVLLLLGISMGLIVLSSRRAQRLARSQMEFVAGVSHELRTPLAVICSAGENLADGVIDRRDQISRYGSLIRDEGRKLAGMVEQVLELAGAHSERRRYELRPADLNTVIENALSICQPQIREGGFEIDRKPAAGLPPIEADAAALSRAIQNLLGNAIKYSGRSRWIGLSVERVKTPSGEEARLIVSDRGLGISPSELSHIFEPFFRGREVTAAQIHGNGLGLSLVKQIIEAHGGRVSVVSRLGQGTSFTLHLPIKPSAESSIDPAQKEYEQAHLAH
ncbi:MAG TPA: HAMP domain-containing sensor histidine kinase, partial [Blastocatellia bacterium]|nr:HAMP domain-containing sensor histidine kinase [Blastocatellia bacterium]